MKKLPEKFIILSILIIVFFLITAPGKALPQAVDSINPQKQIVHAKYDKVEYYKNRYKVDNLVDFITDNHGEGFPLLYGTRNMRVILLGIAYRGGANNVYNKNSKRDNKNPLPDEGLENLFKEGFSTAIYLYGTNFDSAPKELGPDSLGRMLHYLQNSLSNNKQIRQLLELVYKNIKDNSLGPIYLHCWNGWHQSGFASALILRQFCGLDAEAAVKYWTECASGNLTAYEHIKSAIRKFKPYKDLSIPKETQEKICPCMK